MVRLQWCYRGRRPPKMSQMLHRWKPPGLREAEADKRCSQGTQPGRAIRSYLHTSPECGPSPPRPEPNLEDPSPENSRSLQRRRESQSQETETVTAARRLLRRTNTAGRGEGLSKAQRQHHHTLGSFRCLPERRKSECFTQLLAFRHKRTKTQIYDGLKKLLLSNTSPHSWAFV